MTKDSITTCTTFDQFWMKFQSELFCFLRKADNPLVICVYSFFFGKTKQFDYEGLFRIQYGFFSESGSILALAF